MFYPYSMCTTCTTCICIYNCEIDWYHNVVENTTPSTYDLNATKKCINSSCKIINSINNCKQ